MKINILLLLGAWLISQSAIAQTTITLQPDSSGKDAYIDSRLSDSNRGNHIDFPALSWTNGGTLVDGRGLIEFDLTSIPNGVFITSAKLSLYSYNSPANGAHSTESGPNDVVLSRVISSWKESEVTWNNQPSISTQNQVFLASSKNSIQDYLNIDVKSLVRDMIDDSDNSHGFLIKLVTEEPYRRMIFASSDNADSNLHPKLEITYTEAIPSDDCITLQPDGFVGKDAYIDSRLSDSNRGNHNDFPALSWTNGGTLVDGRGLIEFDITDIPDNVIINSAKLSLYSYNSPANGAHSTQSGSNEAVLSRVTSSWDEGIVTWNNQPSITTNNQVFLAASDNNIQDYLDIDVKNLVQDMINDPDNSHGFLMKLVTEQPYRRMIFASSDNADSSLHPKLEICYSIISSTEEKAENNAEFNLFPNPASNLVSIDLSQLSSGSVTIDIINATGQTIMHKSDSNRIVSLDVSNFAKGIYFVKVNSNHFTSIKKLIVE